MKEPLGKRHRADARSSSRRGDALARSHLLLVEHLLGRRGSDVLRQVCGDGALTAFEERGRARPS